MGDECHGGPSSRSWSLPTAPPPPPVPFAGYQSRRTHPNAPSRDVAMNRDRNSHGDDRRDRGRSDRGPRDSPKISRPRSRSPSLVSRGAQGFRDRDYHRDERPRDRQGRTQSIAKRHREDPREGGHGREQRRRDEEALGDDRRGRDKGYNQASHSRHGDDTQGQSRSPSPLGKRRRSLSPNPFPHSNRNKKSKRERSRHRADKKRAKKAGNSRHPRQPSPFGRRSPSPYRGRSSYPTEPRSGRPDLFEHLSRRRSHTPPPREVDFEREVPHSRSHLPHHPPSKSQRDLRRDSHPRDLSRSPRPDSGRPSFTRPHSPHRPTRPDVTAEETGSFSRRSSPAFHPPQPADHPHSPRGQDPPPGPRKKGKRRDDSRFGTWGQPSSGANSIEVNMSRRGDFRGNYSTQGPPAFPAKPHFDPRHNQSPQHVTPGSSYHGSPAQSPYGSNGRGGWHGQYQFSPNGHHASQYGQINFGPPTGPQAQFPQNQSPPYPPTGPSQARGFSRGGFRGGSMSSNRGGPRGGNNFRGSSLNAPTGPAATRGAVSHSGENTPQHSTPQYAASNHSDARPSKEEAGEDENHIRPSKDVRVDDSISEKDEPAPAPRPPPTGPAAGTSGSKFSFSFKATSKAPVAAPKPEISQKFSAAPPRRDPQPVDDRSIRDRDLPRGTPTEPASSRARSDYHHNRQRPPDAPKIRKVKKIEKQLKPKPQVSPDYVKSESVYFRKPGNESVVGSGTYGKVFKGVHIYTKKLVALKKIRMEGERDGFPVTAVREIKLLQSLKHENIVNLEEVMVEKNDCFMVFEYLSHDLTGLLNHPSFKLDAGQRKHLSKQLFEGLDYLHTRGVLHRDIKAANILVSSDGILKIADFGLARFYAKRHQLDYTNRVITIWYRSPELLLGETQYNAAVDIWSAACVMVEIFTRRAIFPGDGSEMNQLDKIYSILGTPNKVVWPDLVKMEWFELLRPSYRKPNTFEEKYRNQLPAAAFELLAAMLQYDPVRRPSAAEVLDHPYFTTEEPLPRQATELATLVGDWHEFESKALRREKEKKEKREREERKATAARESGNRDREKDKKRPSSSYDAQRDFKRPHIEGRDATSSKVSGSTVTLSGGNGLNNSVAK